MSSPILLYRRAFQVTTLGALLLGAIPVCVSAGETESTLRQKLAWQVALDRVGFSPGLIDGKPGRKTEIAIREFQRVHRLPATGQFDDATAEELGVDPANVLGRYTIQESDLAEIGPMPKTWTEKSKLPRLGHEALENVIAEKFHCSIALLAVLNPGKSMNSMHSGDQLVVPSVAEVSSIPKGARLEVNLAEKIIRVIGKDKTLVALFHCSIAKDKEKRPSGEAHVVAVAFDPDYMFKPEMWPEVKEHVSGPLRIPPGPRNPVGRCWVALSLPGYGMHGTPYPELIGKTGSHGCFRLTNWDAIRLGKMVQGGTPIVFSNQPDMQLASSQK